ncbi:MAG: hypothetical protein KA746_00120 [Pyrinomonadaceae bacterium]|nr:hypothetical protein [Pyrinomonadaceae bacterium]MBP6212565.1 hypothetical protein [Pyrinomonadaceae bacterium]
MKRNILLLTALLLTAAIAVAAQGNFSPRDADEQHAWRLYNQYVASKKKEAELIPRIRQYNGDIDDASLSSLGLLGSDSSDVSERNRLQLQLRDERTKQKNLIAAWDRKFYPRYGDLRWSGETVYDAKTKREMDRIEFALVYFPFNKEKAEGEATPSPAVSAGTYTAQKGSPEAWSDIRVTLSNVVDFKSEDAPGWRNNGTRFSAKTNGSGTVGIKITLTGKAGVSYTDYTTGIAVKADGKDLVADKPVISKDGGSRSYSAFWDPGSSQGELQISVSIAGGNPEGFIYYVSGRVTRGTGVAVSTARPAGQASPAATAPPPESRTLYASGNDYGVANGGTPPSFTFKTPTTITQIVSYHWNGGRGAPGGTLALRDSSGNIFGPWNVTVRNGVYWEVNRQIKLPPGTYTVIDSDPSTWAQNSGSGGKGMVTIKGY